MNKIVYSLILLSLFGFGRILAEGEEPNFKTCPPLARTSFIVKIALSNPAPPPVASPDAKPQHPPKTPTEVDVTRFDAIQRNAISWSDGSKTEDWVSGNDLLQRNLYGNWVSLVQIDKYTFKDAYFFVTFRDFFKWISPATFVARQTHEGKPSNYFEQGERKAWIDPKTGTILAYEGDDFLYTFTFREPPSSTLQMPAEYAQVLAAANLPAPTQRR